MDLQLRDKLAIVTGSSKGIGHEAEQEFFKTARPTSLLRRCATTAEVANMVTCVCSPRSSATNGAALRVDGGVLMSAV